VTQPDKKPGALRGREQQCPVAIVGIGCRFPGAVVDPDSFWKLLVEGRSGIREVPSDRWSVDRYYHPDPAVSGTMITKWGGFVDNLDTFDARFWGISPREAMRMDPQQRWLLEVAWEAIEDAGIAPQRLRGQSIGVFVGIAGNDYGALQLPNLADVDAYTNSGSTLSIASNRISYMFDLRGPSVSVDTACSSAAVAVAMACQNIWLGNCDAALVGGVNALITPHATVGFSKAAMVSPSGQCFAFDARANGYVRGEGAGVVYLKPLASALADGNRIYAVIRAAVVNQDGHTSSMTVPSAEGQAEMLREAYRQAGVSPASVVYVEAHGTGTPVGDPIEATALGRVLGQSRSHERKCLIGSVKTNIGHLEAGAGIAGLIKAALIAQRRAIPPNLNYQQPNPHIAFTDLRLEVVDRLRPLCQHDEEPPIVAVNSFGFGGTNAHIVLQAVSPPAPAPSESEGADRPCALAISARHETALREYVEAYRSLLEDAAHGLPDVCAAAGTRKEHHHHRLVVIGRSRQEVRTRLASWLRDGSATGVVSGHTAASTPLVFVFTGQGTQWWAMGRDLFEREPVFRRAIEEIDARFQPLAGWSLVAELFRSEAESRIDHTDVAQPAIFAVQVGLAELWKTWGVQPAKVVGHSVGEVAAAYVAGALSLDDAVTVIFHRGLLMHTTLGTGRMVVVALSPHAAREAIGGDADRVELAGINSPHLVTLSGDAEPLERIAARLEGSGVFTRWLRIQYAFHSRHMDPIEKLLVDALANIRPRAPRLPFVSTVTGARVVTEALDAQYWWDNVRGAVLFEPAISELIRDKDDTFLELGPHPALKSSLKECLAEHGRTGSVFGSLRRDADDSNEMLTTVAGMHVQGVPIDWAAVNQSEGPVVPLPQYPWTRESFWLESKASARLRLGAPGHPLLGGQIAAAVPTWEFTLDLARLSYFNHHRIWDSVVFPAAGYCEIGLALAHALFPSDVLAVADLQIEKALFVDASQPPAIQVVYNAEDKSFAVYSSTGATDAWERHAHGTFMPMAPRPPAPVDLAGIRARLGEHFSHAQCCHEFAIRGYQFGETFQEIRNLWRARGEALAEIEAPPSVAAAVHAYVFHPALLDACFQAFIGTRIAATARPLDDLFLPQSVRRIVLYGERPPARLWAHARLTHEDAASLVSDIRVYGDDGRRVADILGFRLDHVEQKRGAADVDAWAYRFEWEPCPLRDSDVGEDSALRPSAEITAAVRGAVPEVAERHGAGTNAAPAPTVAPRRYVVFADEQGVAEALIDRLCKLGHHSFVVRRGGRFQQEDDVRFRVSPESEDDLRRVLAGDALAGEALAGVIHCWSLDHPRPSGMDTGHLRDAQETGVMSAFRLVRALADRPVPVWFVTRNACRVVDNDPVDGLASTPLVGLTRVANNERQCVFSVVDLEAGPAAEAAEHLAAEITAARDGELELAYRGGIRRALRLRRVRTDEVPKRMFDAVAASGAVTPYRLETDKAGVLTNLVLRETPRLAPAPHEIEVRVRAGGINYRDVMKALGTYPGAPRDLLWFGDDFSGVVERIGDDVRGFRPGDTVAGMAPYAFRSYAITDARMAFRMPRGMSFMQAATLPTVFLTAHYALNHLARLQRGERILIHAAAGGVGQAALQIARSLGLEIFATAGTPEKRRLLSDMGVPHVMSSRNLEFADEIMDITGGRGVDAVLNSLAGDFIAKGLSVLAPFGRFLEIGKVDIYRNAKIGLQPLRNNVSYFVIDVAQHMVEKPALAVRLFAELEERFAAGEYQALPYTSFPITQAADAFRFMAQARHVGKNVLDFDVDHVPIGFCAEDAQRFRPDASYLITGGAGGFGLEVAKWMARHGARHLVLMSRTGPRDAAARCDLDELRADGVRVIDARGDVTREDDVRRVVKDIDTEGRSLKGVFHAAMVLDDDSLTGLDEARFARVLEPKMAGAWNLHLATRESGLEHFVCFSSFSVVAGAPRQSAYNAGNAFLGALAHYRRGEGVPALTVDWGIVRGAGFVERNQRTAEYLEKSGFDAFRVDEALRIFGRLLSSDVAHIVAARVNWRSLARLSTLVGSSPTYAAMAQETETAEGHGSVSARLRAARAEERAGLIEDFIVAQVAGVFGMAEGRLDRTAPLTSLGLDSLMTVELINRVDTQLGLRIPMGNLLSGPSIKELAQIVLRLLIPTLDAGEPTTGSVEATESGHVVPIRAAGNQPPLIGFHPVGGGVGIYGPFARALPGDVPLYGIESRLVRGAEREFADVDAMVRAYVAAVREVTPSPYRLFGFSFGGYLAARVAEALERDGEQVDFVGVVEWDARPMETLQTRRDALLRLSVATYHFLSHDMAAVRPLPESRLHVEMGPLVDRILGERPARGDLYFQWAVDNGLFVSDSLQGWGRQYVAGFGQHLAMIAHDLPQPRFQAPLVVWRASDGFGSALDSWGHEGAIAIEHVIAGDHFAFLRPPGVVGLARQMDEFLRQRRAVEAGTLAGGK
jgi:acyl transferase domain-containing protein/NADPH:quinone reductase-like Zn-dependent oxidoreductase/thioesterase domain-containing protein/acyl carrier protein